MIDLIEYFQANQSADAHEPLQRKAQALQINPKKTIQEYIDIHLELARNDSSQVSEHAIVLQARVGLICIISLSKVFIYCEDSYN